MPPTCLEFELRDRAPALDDILGLDPAGDEDRQRERFEGLWRSEKGSLYASDGRTFVCVSVCSPNFRGWLGKVTIRDVQRVAGRWVGWQSFRDPQTGGLGSWEKIDLVVGEKRIVKHFPRHIPRDTLVYGYVETYYRVTRDC
jgi:hypothetical protein